jgi:hypothetical protein
VYEGWKAKEPSGNDEVGEAVIADEDSDAAFRGLDEGPLELAACGVALEDERPQQYLALSVADRGEHVVVEVLAIGVDRRHRFPDGQVGGGSAREAGAMRADALAPRVHAGKSDHERCLRCHEGDQKTPDDGPHRVQVAVTQLRHGEPPEARAFELRG